MVNCRCVGVYFIPLCIIIYTYSRIAWTAYKGKLQRTPSTLPGLRPRQITETQRKQQIKSAKTSFCFVLGWLWAWTPYAVLSLIGIFGYYDYLTSMAYHLCSMLAKTSVVYTPISR